MLRWTISLGSCQLLHPKVPYHAFAKIANLMTVWTSTSYWCLVLAGTSALISSFVSCCLIACLVVDPYLVPHSPLYLRTIALSLSIVPLGAHTFAQTPPLGTKPSLQPFLIMCFVIIAPHVTFHSILLHGERIAIVDSPSLLSSHFDIKWQTQRIQLLL